MEDAAKSLDLSGENYNSLMPIFLAEIGELQSENVNLKDKLSNSEKINNILREQIRLSKLRQFDRKSEQVHEQFEMIFDEVELKPEEPTEEPIRAIVKFCVWKHIKRPTQFCIADYFLLHNQQRHQ